MVKGSAQSPPYDLSAHPTRTVRQERRAAVLTIGPSEDIWGLGRGRGAWRPGERGGRRAIRSRV